LLIAGCIRSGCAHFATCALYIRLHTHATACCYLPGYAHTGCLVTCVTARVLTAHTYVCAARALLRARLPPLVLRCRLPATNALPLPRIPPPHLRCLPTLLHIPLLLVCACCVAVDFTHRTVLPLLPAACLRTPGSRACACIMIMMMMIMIMIILMGNMK